MASMSAKNVVATTFVFSSASIVFANRLKSTTNPHNEKETFDSVFIYAIEQPWYTVQQG